MALGNCPEFTHPLKMAIVSATLCAQPVFLARNWFAWRAALPGDGELIQRCAACRRFTDACGDFTSVGDSWDTFSVLNPAWKGRKSPIGWCNVTSEQQQPWSCGHWYTGSSPNNLHLEPIKSIIRDFHHSWIFLQNVLFDSIHLVCMLRVLQQVWKSAMIFPKTWKGQTVYYVWWDVY